LGKQALGVEFPAGTLLLVAAGEYARSGDLVLARLADRRQAVVARYGTRDGCVSLTPVDGGTPIGIDPRETPGRLVWAWPVVQARIHYR
jgi:SOS-response transcriptional repressor LexA